MPRKRKAVQGSDQKPESATQEESQKIEDQAAQVYSAELPRYESLLEYLSKNELIRLNKALMKYGFTKEPFIVNGERESEATKLALELKQAQLVMYVKFVSDLKASDEAKQAKQESLPAQEEHNV